jgi:betaine-homocysteine S-methyltransferase
VPYRCSHKYPFFVSLEDESTKDKHFWGKPFPTALEPFLCNRYDVAEFGKRAVEAGA